MVIFHSYVKLPEGSWIISWFFFEVPYATKIPTQIHQCGQPNHKSQVFPKGGWTKPSKIRCFGYPVTNMIQRARTHPSDSLLWQVLNLADLLGQDPKIFQTLQAKSKGCFEEGNFTGNHYQPLVGGLEHFLFFHVLGITIPTD